MVIWLRDQKGWNVEDMNLKRIRVRETPTIYTDYYGPASE